MNRIALVALTLSLAVGSVVAQSHVRVVRGAAWVTPEGEIKKEAAIVIADGRIRAINGELPKDAAIDEFERAVICPGLIDAHAALSALGQLRETAAPLEPTARAKDSFDRFHPHLIAALRAGVTTYALCPDDGNIVGGRIAICQTYGPQKSATILSDAGPIKLSISPAAFLLDREPTSRSGALAMLRGALAGAKNAKDANAGPLGELVRGKLTAYGAAPAGADVASLLALAEEFKFKLTLLHTRDAQDVADEIARESAGVIVGPLDFSSSLRETAAAGALAAKGVKVAIAGGLPTAAADSLRIGAAIAARHGLAVAAARQAITSTPAAFLGVADQVGRIEPGLRADLVVFSGDPLDLRSRVLAVYVGGVRVPIEAAAVSR